MGVEGFSGEVVDGVVEGSADEGRVEVADVIGADEGGAVFAVEEVILIVFEARGCVGSDATTFLTKPICQSPNDNTRTTTRCSSCLQLSNYTTPYLSSRTSDAT